MTDLAAAATDLGADLPVGGETSDRAREADEQDGEHKWAFTCREALHRGRESSLVPVAGLWPLALPYRALGVETVDKL